MKDFDGGTRNYTDAIPYKDSYKDGSRSDMQIDYVRVWQPNAKPVTTEAPTTTTTTTTVAPTTTTTTTYRCSDDDNNDDRGTNDNGSTNDNGGTNNYSSTNIQRKRRLLQ